MAQVTITQLPLAGALTGTESVPIVQNGQTVRTTTANIAAQPSQTQTFLTKNQEPSLPNSRYLAVGTGLSLTDGGAQSTYQIGMSGAAASLNAAAVGLIAKDSATTVASRSIAVSGSGLSVSNADGSAGNPTISLASITASIQNLGTGTGLIALNGVTAVLRRIYGTSNQITVVDGDSSGDPTISLASNPELPGTAGVLVPVGTTGQRSGSPTNGVIRYNSTTQTFEGYANSAWRDFSLTGGVISFSAGTTGLTPAAVTTGAITLGGILLGANGGTGVANTGKTITLGDRLRFPVRMI